MNQKIKIFLGSLLFSILANWYLFLCSKIALNIIILRTETELWEPERWWANGLESVGTSTLGLLLFAHSDLPSLQETNKHLDPQGTKRGHSDFFMVVNVGYNEQTAYASYLRISLLKNFVFWEAEWTSLAYSRFLWWGLALWERNRYHSRWSA